VTPDSDIEGKVQMLESTKRDLTDKSVQGMGQSPEFQKLAQKAR
jgi:hypothetical protein